LEEGYSSRLSLLLRDALARRSVRAEILALEDHWATAIERQDAAAFDRLAAEPFRFIDDVLRSIAFGSRRLDSR
jgi:hypothetical protein